MSKAKASAAYNQTVMSTIISIVKYGKLPDDSKCEAFMGGSRIPGGDRTGFPELPKGERKVDVVSVLFMSLLINLNAFTARQATHRRRQTNRVGEF